MDKIKVANAPCSWGILEFGLEGDAAGAQQVLQEISASGFAGTELGDWGFLPTDPVTLSAMLGRYGLSLVGAFVPVALADANAHEAGVEVAIRTADLLANSGSDAKLVLADDNGKDPERSRLAGRIGPAQALGADRWQTFVDGAERIARSVKERTGISTVFHHHCAGYVETRDEVDYLLKNTSPDLLGLCLDTGHYMYGGGDPLQALKTYGDRVWHIHFKDCDEEVADTARIEGWDYFESVRRGVFCELGNGGVDFPGIVEQLRRCEYRGWIVVEQDIMPGMGTPLESALRNRNYLDTLFP